MLPLLIDVRALEGESFLAESTARVIAFRVFDVITD